MQSGKTCFITVAFNDSDAKKHSVFDRMRQKVIFSESLLKMCQNKKRRSCHKNN